MKLRTIIVIALLFLLILFAAINWSAFTTPFSLSFLFGDIQMPLGVFMLGFVGLLAVIFLLFLGKAETVALLEARKQHKELEKARKLADDEELSRINELRRLIETRFDELHARLDVALETSEPSLGDPNREPSTP
ncbi:MAG: LapA family protein [Rhodothermales bacterium]